VSKRPPDSRGFDDSIALVQMVGVSTYYPSPAGDAEFVKLSSELVFGEKEIPARVMGVQTGRHRRPECTLLSNSQHHFHLHLNLRPRKQKSSSNLSNDDENDVCQWEVVALFV
jgi:hypothetical protein